MLVYLNLAQFVPLMDTSCLPAEQSSLAGGDTTKMNKNSPKKTLDKCLKPDILLFKVFLISICQVFRSFN